MNKVYKVVWNASLGTWVAVSEIAKGKTKNSVSIGQTVLVDNSYTAQLDKEFSYKKLLLAIFTVFTANFAHAGYYAGNNGGCGGATELADTVAIGSAGGNGAGTSGSPATGGGNIVGNAACVYSPAAMAIGNNARAYSYSSIAIGSGAQAGQLSQANGTSHGADGNGLNGSSAMAIGNDAKAIGIGTTAIGRLAQTNADRTTVIGNQSYIKNSGSTNSIIIGNNTEIGDITTAVANATAIGQGGKILATGGTTVGQGAEVSIAGSVAIGQGAKTTAIGGAGFLTGSTAPASVVSVGGGTTTATRRIQNLADGANAQDAVTVAQLDKAYDDAHNNLKNVLGGNATYNAATNTYTAPTNIGGTNKNTIDEAISSVKGAAETPMTFVGNARNSGDTKDVERKLGESLKISGAATTAGSYSGANVKTVTDQTGSIAIQIADAPNFAGTVTSTGQQVNGNSVVTGTSTIGSGANAVTLSGTANGLDVGGKKITNVAAPTLGSDATNKTYVDGKVQTLADTPLGFVGDSGTKATRKLGEDLNVKGGATGTLTNGNIGVVSNGSNQLDIKLAETVNLGTNGSVTTGNTKIDNSGLTITGGPSVTSTGINAGSKVITNVAAGSAATDAVNKGQLDSSLANANSNAAVVYTNAAGDKVTKAADGKWYAATDVNADGSLIGSPGEVAAANIITSVQNASGSTTTATKLGNVAAGSVTASSTDAINGSQLYNTANNVKNIIGSSAAIDTSTGAITTSNIGGTGKNTIDEAISSVKGAAETPMTFVGNARNSGDTKDVERKLGESLKISGAATTAGTYSGANVKTVTDQTGSIAIQIADAPNFAGTVTSTGQQVNGNSVVTGTSTIGSGANAVTLSGTANGLDVGGKKITNVAAPTLGSDATNKTYVDGKVQTLADTPLGFVGDSGTKATRKLGEDLNVKGGATGTLTNGNIGVVSNGSNQLDIKLAETVNLGTNGSVTTGNTKIDNSGLTITGGPSVTSTGINAGSKVITNVAAGSAATDAVNKGQLDSSLANANSNAAVVYTNAAGDKVTKAADGKWYAATDVNADGSLIGSPGEVAAANIITSVQNASGSTTTATKLGNVAAGSVTASSTDAINGSQLYNTANNVKNIIGSSAAIDTSTGAITTSNIGGTGKNTIDEAISSVKGAAETPMTFVGNARNSGDTKDVERKLGESLKISGAATTAGSYSGANVKTVTDQTGSIAIQIADAPNFAGTVTSTGQQVNGNSVVTGTSTIGSGANAVTLSGTANGLDVGGKKITNVAAPTLGSDATNKTYVDGKVQTLADTPLGFVGDSGTKATRKLGEDLNVKGGATGTLTNGNIGVVSNGSNQLDIKLAETVNLGTNGSVTTGNTKIDNSGLTITGGPSVTSTGINAGSKVITNVAAGSAATDAVNKGQLDSSLANANSNAAVVYTNAAGDKVTKAADGKWYAATDVNADGSLIGSPGEVAAANIITSVQNASGSTTTATKLGNVAAGSVTASSTDAINGSQLYNTANNVKNIIGSSAAIDTSTGAITTSNIGGTGKNTIDEAISSVKGAAETPMTFVGNARNSGDTKDVERKLGESLKISGAATTAGTYSGANVKTVTDQTGSIAIQIADAPNFAGTVTSTGQQVNGNSVVTGTSTIGSGANAVTLSGTANGLDVGGKKITNVAAPTLGSDATNKTYVDGKVQTLADTPLGFVGDSGTKATRKLGEDLNVKGGATGTLTNGNIGVVSNGSNQLDIKLAETVNLGTNGSVTTGNTKIDNSGLTITGGPSVTSTGINAGSKVITNVAAGSAATDAVNKGQLDSSLANANSNAAVVYTNAAGDKVTKAADGKWYAATDVNADGSLIGSPGEVAAANIITSVQNASGSTTTATKLGNVAAGSVTASSTDAINGSQLYNTANNVKNIIGSSAAIDTSTGAITTSNIGGTGKNTIDEAISSVKGAAETPMTFVGNARNSGDTKDVERKLGESLKISGAATTAGSYSGANVKTVTDQTGSIAIQIADAPNFAGTVTSTGQQVNGNSVVTGTSTIGSGANAVTLSGTANGLDVGGKKITNVAAPTLGSDATNKTYVDGKVQTLADTPLGFVGDSGTKATRKLGEDLNVKGGATGTLTNGNIGVVSNGSNQLDIKLAETVNLGTNGSVTTGNTKIDNSGLTITGGPSVTSTGINAGSKVITNVAAGSAATDAVNKGQLDSSLANANSNAAVVYTNAAGDKVTKAADGKWYAATDVNADGSLIGSPGEVAAANIITSVQNASGSTTTATKLGNVAAGSVTASSTDAINGSQLYNTANNVKNIIGSSAAIDTSTGAITTSNIGGTGKNTIDEAISSVKGAAETPMTFVGNARNSGDTKDVERKLGESLKISGAATTAGTYSGANVKTVTDQTGSIAIQIADAPNFAGTVTSTGQQVNGNSVVTGTSTIGSGANAVTLSGTANGLDVGGKKITNVAAPTLGSDATNKTYVDGKVQTLADTPLGFVGDSGTKATRKLGEDLNVKGGATGTLTNGNIGVVSNGSNQLDIKLAETVNLGTNGSVTTGNTKIDNSGLTITGGPSVTSTGINAGSKVITNVAAGSAATDAVNKGQLDSSLANANSNAAVVYTNAAGDKVTKAADGKWYAATDVNADGSLIGSPGEVAAANIITSVQNASGSTTTATKLGNVAAGSVTASSTDAINGSQLYNTANNVKNIIGSSAAIDTSTGAITTSNIGGTGKNTIDEAISSVKGAAETPMTFVGNARNSGDTKDVERKLGESLKISGAATTAGSYSGANVKTVTDQTGSIAIQIADAPNFAGTVTSTGQQVNGNSVVTGTSTIGSGANAVTLSGTANGLDVGGKKITNVAAPTLGSDATNKTYVDGKVQTLADTPLGFVGDSGTKATRKLGEDLNVKGGATGTLTNGNIGVVSNGSNQLDIKLAETVNLGTNGSVTTGNTKIDNSGLTITGGPSVTSTGINAGSKVITNVAAGSAATDAVNKGQLDSSLANANSNAAVVYTNAAGDKVTKAADGKWYAATDVNADGSLIGSPGEVAAANIITSVQNASGSTTTATKLGNVAAGSVTASSTDAINGSQLYNTANNVKNLIGGTTTIDANTGVITTSNIGGTGKNTIDEAISSVKGAAETPMTFVGNARNSGDTKDVERKLGESLTISGAATTAGSYSGKNVRTVTDQTGSIAIELADNLDVTSVTTGNTVINNAGVTADKVTVGNVVIDKTTNQISGVEAGTNTKDAVNKGQLDALAAQQAASDNAAVKYDDAAVKDKVTLAGATGTTLTNVKAGDVSATSTDAVNGSQLFTTNQKVDQNTTNIATNTANIAKNTGDISTLNTTVTNQGNEITTLKGGFNLQTNGTNAGAIKAGDTVDIGVVDLADTNLTATKTGNNVAFALSKDLSLNSVNANQLAVGDVVVDKSTNTISGLSNKDLTAADFATQGRAATEEQLKQVISSNITEVVDGNGNKVNIIDQVVNTKPDNKNQDSLFLTYDKQGQETTDRLTIAQTVQKMNTEGVKFFHTNADTSKGDLGTTNDSSAGGLNSTAVGVNAIVETDAVSALAVGHDTKAGGAQSIAIGNGAEALGTQSISIGTGNKVTGDHSGAIGDPTIVDGSNSYSVGNNNQVLTDDTFVLGNNVTQTVTGSVVLGTGSAATTGAGVAGYALSTATTADKTAISNTTSTTGAVAIGDAANGIYRQITGVAAGSQDSDAVNVAQLKAVGNQVTTTQTSLVNSLGGNAKVNADGSITGPTYNVAQGTQTNVGDALTALDQAIGNAATTSKTTVSNGENIVVSKTKNADGSDNYQVSTAKDLTVDSIKAGETVLNNAGIAIANNAVVLNNTGLVIAGGPSVTTQGINAGNKQVTNVAAGTNATDAVNKGQLDSAINNVNNNVNQLANNAVKYDDATKDKITLGGANGTTISNVKDGTVAQGSKEAVNGGQLWNVQQQVNQNTSDIENIQTNINNINNGKSGLVQQQTPNGDITIGKDTGGTKVSVAGKDGDRVVTGVKDGVISATSKDAVNGSQLNVTNNKVVEFLGGGAGYDNITNSFTNPTYTVGGKEYNNVGGAVDALNKADQALDSKIDNVSNRLEQAFYSTNQRIDDVEKRANAGIAAAMALEAAPFIAGKYTYAAGASYHGGENAVGVTLRKTADNGRWSITGGVAAASQGDPSVRIGISGVID